MILWTPVPMEQVLEGFDANTYPKEEIGEIEGIPVLLEKVEDGKRRVVRINSSDPTHYLNQAVYPGLVI